MLKIETKYQICLIILLIMTKISYLVIHVQKLTVILLIVDLISIAIINKIEKLTSDC